MTTIPRMKADESTDEMARALGEAGCLVVTDAFDAEVRAEVAQAMRPHLDALPAEWIETDDPDAFYPGHTRRAIAVVERAEAARELVMHPVSAALCERFRPIDHVSVVRGNRKLEKPAFHKAAAEGNFFLRGFTHLMIFKKERG